MGGVEPLFGLAHSQSLEASQATKKPEATRKSREASAQKS